MHRLDFLKTLMLLAVFVTASALGPVTRTAAALSVAPIDPSLQQQMAANPTRLLPVIVEMQHSSLPTAGANVQLAQQALNLLQLNGTAQVALPQNPDQRILIEPRGTRRLSSQSLLDVRLSRAIAVGGMGHVELLVDVLNALNDTAEEGLATDNLLSANFGQPTAFVDPRRAMIGVRVNVGR